MNEATLAWFLQLHIDTHLHLLFSMTKILNSGNDQIGTSFYANIIEEKFVFVKFETLME
jgi:hypothetical protein